MSLRSVLILKGMFHLIKGLPDRVCYQMPACHHFLQQKGVNIWRKSLAGSFLEEEMLAWNRQSWGRSSSPPELSLMGLHHQMIESTSHAAQAPLNSKAMLFLSVRCVSCLAGDAVCYHVATGFFWDGNDRFLTKRKQTHKICRLHEAHSQILTQVLGKKPPQSMIS